MRRFYLQNEAGERFGLNGERGVYFAQPEGLGVALSPSFGDLGRGFFAVTNDAAEPQNAVAGTLFFRGPGAYALYEQLIDWVFRTPTLTLVYSPVSETEYYRRVCINFIAKGELNALGWLECPCSVLPLSPWYRPVPTELELGQGTAGDALVYTYAYTEELRYGSDSAASMSGIISAGGHTPAAILLSYRGAISDPVIRLVGSVSGRTYGVCSVHATLSASDTLELSTLYEDSYIRKLAADGTVTDLIDDVDPGTEHYFHVPTSEACTISVESSALFTGTAVLYVYYYYKSR